MASIVVVEHPRNWNLDIPEVEIVAAREYLSAQRFSESRRMKVINLCRGYGYQTLGYYVSLLAEARGHRPMPSVATLQDLRLSPVLRVISDEFDDLLQRAGGEPTEGPRVFPVYFGDTRQPGVERLARTLFNYFPSPLLRVELVHAGRWRLESVRPIAAAEIPTEERVFVSERAARYFARPARPPASTTAARYDLAILFNPEEKDPPSDDRAIQRFVRAARELGMAADVIGREDFGKLSSYDALFIRETTAVNHHTYRFARRAEAEGLVVLDAPSAIIQATNKVFQAELFTRHGIAMPRTRIVSAESATGLGEELGYPVVLKRPDSSFSQGVEKAADATELQACLARFLERSELIVAQEYTPSEFDWRIGVLDRQFFYACRYHMAPGHWQIQQSGNRGWRRYGATDSVTRAEAPADVIDLAVRAAGLIGDGLFGVDIKVARGKPCVIEVNDNPSIEVGFEDGILGDGLYTAVMRWFLDRLEQRGIPTAAR